MWSWGKIGKEWNYNDYYQEKISQNPHGACLTTILLVTQIFPDLAMATQCDFQERTTSGQLWSYGWVLSLWCIISALSPGKDHITGAHGQGFLKHQEDNTQGRKLRAPAPLTHWHSFPLSAKIMGFQTLSLLFLPLVYIFLFVDNNLMCLETASRGYVPLGIILILLQMVGRIFFLKMSHEL